MGRPAVFADGAVARRSPQAITEDTIGQRREGMRESCGYRAVVQKPLAIVLDERGDTIEGGRDDGQARRHVLEDLQRRPVEAEGEGEVYAGVERGRRLQEAIQELDEIDMDDCKPPEDLEKRV